ncbi:MAG TPA: Hsp70 family protein [Actinomycetota bacterium]|nr:Hsp70 family protein [Actinomycetota bacterium]
MTYELGIDLGTTYTAAAVQRDGRVEVATLGERAASIPSVIYLREDDEILTGEGANRRGTTEPGRVAREFKRRVGDPTPLILGGSPLSAEALSARLLRWSVGEVARREGSSPDRITVSHPANWGPYKKDRLGEIIRLADLDAPVETITEPEAAAIYYSSQERVDPGSVIAVYDLGGGTFDAAVLRKTESGFEILGEPEGIDRLGGIDFDEAVFAHVAASLGGAFEELDPADPAAIAAVARLRADCMDAKEALSNDTEVTIPVMLPNVQTQVRLTRAEFEDMVRPAISETIDAMRRALRSAGVEPEQVTKVLLVGGSSRIPLVARMVSAELGRPVAVDAHPKHAIALGAALHAASVGGTAPDECEVVVDVEPVSAANAVAAGAVAAGALAGAGAAATEAAVADETAAGEATVPIGAAEETAILAEAREGPPPAPTGPPKRSRRGLLIGLVVLVLAAAGGAYFLLFAGDGGGEASATRRPSPTESPSPSPEPTEEKTTVVPPPPPPQTTTTTTATPPSDCTDQTGAGGTATVVATDDPAFTPGCTQMRADQSLVIQNAGADLHSFTMGGFYDQDITPGTSFDTGPIGATLTPGEYLFICKYHPSQTGELRIVEA